jgi:hypothetical protein
MKIHGGGDAWVGKLLAGTTFEQIGPTITGAGSNHNGTGARQEEVVGQGLVHRFRGQIWAITWEGTNLYYHFLDPFDEGGTNDWVENRRGAVGSNYPRWTARGGYGVRTTAGEVGGLTFSPYFTIVTPDQDYLVIVYAIAFADEPGFSVFDPDATFENKGIGSAHGQWTRTQPAGAHANANYSYAGFVHDGLLYAAYGQDSADSYWSFNPATKATVKLNRAFNGAYSHHFFFSLFDRLFIGCLDDGPAAFNSEVSELISGSWTNPGFNPRLGSDTRATRAASFQISIGKVLTFAYGTDLATGTINGFQCRLWDTVGGTPGGALQMTDKTAEVITASGFSFTGGQQQGCFGYTSTSDPLGTIRHYLYWMSNTVGPSTVVCYEVVDETTPLSLVGVTDITSDYSLPFGYYGGGEVENGIDQSTRLVTVSPRGWAPGTTGLKVRCSAHGDPPVLAHPALTGKSIFHGAVTSGPFQIGETLTGGSSGATGTISGVAPKCLHVTSITGTFVAGETITGGTSTATAVASLQVLGSTTRVPPYRDWNPRSFGRHRHLPGSRDDYWRDISNGSHEQRS